MGSKEPDRGHGCCGSKSNATIENNNIKLPAAVLSPVENSHGAL